MAVAERLREGEHSVPGGHPGEQRLKGWQESDQGPPSGHRLFHSRLLVLVVRDGPSLQTAAGALNLLASPGRSPVPRPGLFLPML